MESRALSRTVTPDTVTFASCQKQPTIGGERTDWLPSLPFFPQQAKAFLFLPGGLATAYWTGPQETATLLLRWSQTLLF
jgi:hypothetical protein